MGITLTVEKMEFRQLTEEIKRTMRRSARDAVQLGFMLRRVMDECLWEADHSSFDGYLQEELHMDYSLASRFMAINKKFSLRGNSMDINPEYQEYSQGALIEMLNMSPELEEKVMPEMTVREVREIKRQARREKEETVTGCEDIPGQTSIQKDFREYMPDGYEDEKKTIPEPEKATEIIDGEYCEVPQEQGEEVATSQGEISQEECDAYWFVRQYMEILPGDAETAIEVCRAEGDDSKRGKALQEYISPYGCHHTGCSEWQFDFLNFSKGVDMRIGTAKMRLTYNRFAKALMEVVVEKENKDKQNCTDEKLSAYGLPVTEYPEGSLLTTEGCGNRHSCFSCAQDCGIRQKDRYCCEAPMGNPFPCTTMNTLVLLGREMGNACQFIDQEKAYHRAGDNAAVPCCKECSEICGYRCARSVAEPHEVKESADTLVEFQEGVGNAAESVSTVKEILAKEKKQLSEYAQFDDIPEMTVLRQKIMVAALELMAGKMEAEEQKSEREEAEQPELPPLKNADKRKAWLRNYKAWGLWYRDENIDVNYYKYDFSDGSRLIVAEYPQRQAYWRKETEDEYYFHMLEKGKKGYGDIQYDDKYRNMIESETYLVEFLKNIQKR